MQKFEIFIGTNGLFYFHLRAAGNHEIILQSEGYTTKEGCQNGIASVKINAPFDERYERKLSTNYKYFFVLKAVNGQPIGVSQMYQTAANRDHGIALVKTQAPSAPVVDLTVTAR